MATDPQQLALTAEQLHRLAELSIRTGKPQQELLTEALRQYDPGESNGTPKDVKESLYARLAQKGLIGCLTGGPSDLSTSRTAAGNPFEVLP